MAARRISFNIVTASSEDEGHPSTELNQQNPQTKGWQSERFCAFPQEICIALQQRCDLVQLQVRIPTLHSRCELTLSSTPRCSRISIRSHRKWLSLCGTNRILPRMEITVAWGELNKICSTLLLQSYCLLQRSCPASCYHHLTSVLLLHQALFAEQERAQ